MATSSIFDFEVVDINGKKVSLNTYKGKVLVFVNVASKCGLTPQYKELEALYQKYRDRGLVILGFPCNQFGAQEPGSEAEIAQFCSLEYAVTFPMFSKIDVNGANVAPLYAYLKSNAKGILGTEAIKWNFTKFLVDKSGSVVKRYAPTDAPVSLEKDIESLL